MNSDKLGYRWRWWNGCTDFAAVQARVEGMILQFIKDRYGTANLLHMPEHVAREILKRPSDFMRAAKNYCEPELNF